ncbi:Flp family type IVb pilin [Gluconacetobacter azotocaptans]|uniref:Flp family type IVb pilin n=1 Tax=Gluconacetobacter azotocaptans TaxID=142834 RepID=UPI00195AA474|nr:Flp family type IVb pilin [Gluconacetobacter azotocaptans]MBM9401007.1 Flp family type IVb pilin [Gluconacetobacter azotocaptans]
MFQHLMGLAGLKRDRRGVTMLEYGLIAALVAVVAVAALRTMGGQLNSALVMVGDKVPAPASGS